MTILFTSSYPVLRSSPGQHIKGKYVRGPSVTVSIEATWQPVSGKDLLNLTELQRTKNTIKIYSEDELVGLDPLAKTSADIITINGLRFEIQNVKYYDDSLYPCPHYKALGVELNKND